MPKPKPLAIEAVISNTGNPISFAGGEDEAGKLVLQIFVNGEQIERLLALRGKPLKVVLVED